MKAPRNPRLLPAILLFVGVISMDLSTCIAQSPWTQKADRPYSAFAPSACIFEGKLYVMGGLDSYSPDETNDALDSVSVYDLEQDSWSLRANMPSNNNFFSSFVYNGKILTIGGMRSVYYTPVSAIEFYDPVSDTWSHLTDIPLAGVLQASTILDDKLYVFGGAKSDYDSPYDKVQIYDLISGVWTEGAEMPTPRSESSAITVNDKIYVIGGQQGKTTGWLGMKTVEVYDPASDSWMPGTDMILPRKWLATCYLDSCIYVFGGLSGSCTGWHSRGELYDLKTDCWREIGPNKKLIGGVSISTSNGNVYVLGGDEFTSCIKNAKYDVRSLFLYEPYFDLYPMLDSTFVDKNAVNAGADSVLISTKMYDPTGITLSAKLTTLEGMPRDSIQLYDDGNHNDGSAGDSLFANIWQVNSTEELQYSLCVEATQMGSDTIVNEFANREVIATKELVTYEGFSYHPDDMVPDPGDYIQISINLKNNSSITTTKIKARLNSLNELAWVMPFFDEFQEMAPGETATTDFFTTPILENCPRDTVLAFAVDISSYDHLFRTDTIFMSVAPDTTSYVSDHSSYPVRIYPNPADDLITIETGQSGPLWIEITSLNGQQVFGEKRMGEIQLIDLSSFQKGVYFITIRSKDFVTTRKIIKLF